MAYSFLDFLNLLGALGLFLFGMKGMSDGIQKFAGEKLRSIIGVMTRNRFMGIMTGLIITGIIQSSSATTVMVVGFVNAGLLSLAESIAVIMGANIGTTVTAWLISFLGFSFSISIIAIPVIGIGFPMLFSKKDKLKSFGEFLIGFALLFIGLDFLKNAVPDFSAQARAFEFVKSISNHGILSTLMFVLIGTVVTMIVQSSSAAMALTLIMCNNGWIGFEAGAAFVLGENIGTTITANLAALMGNVYAKRAALAHTFFNVIGVLWMLLLFSPFLELINLGMASINAGSPFYDTRAMVIGLCVFHTAFNSINTLFLVGFVNSLEKLVIKVIPSKGEIDEQFRLEYIGSNIVNTSEINIVEAKKEVIIFAKRIRKMAGYIPTLLGETDEQEFLDLANKIKKHEDIADRMELEIADFLVRISREKVSQEVSRDLRGMLRMISNLEKIADIVYKMSITIQRKNADKAWFTQKQRDNLKQLMDTLNIAFENMITNLELENGKASMQKAIEIESNLNSLRDKIRDEHFISIEKGEYNIKSGLYYNTLYSACEKIGDHIFNINEATTGINVE